MDIFYSYRPLPYNNVLSNKLKYIKLMFILLSAQDCKNSLGRFLHFVFQKDYSSPHNPCHCMIIAIFIFSSKLFYNFLLCILHKLVLCLVHYLKGNQNTKVANSVFLTCGDLRRA